MRYVSRAAVGSQVEIELERAIVELGEASAGDMTDAVPAERADASTQEIEPERALLGIELGDREATRLVDGERRTVTFPQGRQWKVFRAVLSAGEGGLTPEALREQVWGDALVGDDAISNGLWRTQKVLKGLHVKITSLKKWDTYRLVDLDDAGR